MAVISDQNSNVCTRDPSGILQCCSFSKVTIWGHANNDVHTSTKVMWNINLLCMCKTETQLETK